MDGMTYEMTPRRPKVKKPTPMTRGNRKKITVKTHKEVTTMTAKNDYKKAKALHKREIKKLRAEIKKHKLLIKQAKLTYKLSK